MSWKEHCIKYATTLQGGISREQSAQNSVA